jgi:hypothetical protein
MPPRPRRSRAWGEHLKVLDRRKRAFELRRGGASFPQIVTRIREEFDAPRYDSARAYRDVAAMLIPPGLKRDIEEYREEEVARLDTAQMAIWNRVLAGDLPAIDRLLRIIEVRSRLRGSFAPVKVAGHDGGPLKVEAVAQLAVLAVVKVIDKLDLDVETRAAYLEEIKAGVLSIEAPTAEPEAS